MNRIQEFYGYKRPSGDVGVRNDVIVIAVMDNSNPVARRITAAVKGTIPVFTSFGRSLRDREMHDRVMAGLGANPNTVVSSVDNIDVDVSAIIKGEKSVAEASEVLYQELLDVANGKMARSEILGDVEIAISVPREA